MTDRLLSQYDAEKVEVWQDCAARCAAAALEDIANGRWDDAAARLEEGSRYVRAIREETGK